MKSEKHARAIRDAKEAVLKAEKNLESARDDLDRAIARAYKDGERPTHIAEVAGITRQTAYQGLRRRNVLD